MRHVETGGLPFVGLLVDDVGWGSDPGVNLVQETGDPTAHAEVVAIRQAVRARGVPALEGATLLATQVNRAQCAAAPPPLTASPPSTSPWTASPQLRGGSTTGPAKPPNAPTACPLRRQPGTSPSTEALEPFTKYIELHHSISHS